MEFSFNLFGFLADIDSHPEYMVMWAAFGVPALMLALTLPLYIFRLLGLYPRLKPFYSVLYISLTITWILGFITTILLFFTKITGVRLLIIWVLMYATYLVFCIFNRNSINRGIETISKKAGSLNNHG